MKYSFLFGCLAMLLLVACDESYQSAETSMQDSVTAETSADSTGAPPFMEDRTISNQMSIPNTMTQAMEALTMAIDSSYSAIRLLEAEKAQLMAVPAAQLQPPGRLSRSTAINELNQMQRNIAAQTDALILQQLKTSTQRLDALADAMEKDVERLKLAAARLRTATQVVTRLTDYLAFCLSNQWIKPATPPNATPQEVKQQVLAMH